MIPIDLLIDLFIGIPLTCAAWSRGWKGWALLLLPASYAVSFITGIVLVAFAGPYASEGSLEAASSVAVWVIMLVTYGVLIAMVIKGRKRSTRSEMVEASQMEPVKMFCPKCGEEQEDNPNYCRGCGENLGLKARYGCA